MGDEDAERRIAELTREVAMLRAAIRASPVGIIVASAPNGHVVAWNDAALGLRGGDADRLTSIGALDDYVSRWQTYREDGALYEPNELPLARAMLAEEVVCGETVIIRDEDGNERWTSTHAAPAYDPEGALLGAVAISPEITRRKEAELAAERFRRMAELSPDFIGVFLEDGTVEYINPGGLNICGITEDIAAELRLFDLYTEESAALVTNEGVPAAKRSGFWRGEVELRHTDGSPIPCSQVLMSYDEEGTGPVLSVVIHDLRAVRDLEAQLRQSQRLESTGRLAGGIAHDFNNLLTIIINYASLVRESFEDDDRRAREMEQIQLASQRAAELCGQLLSFARRQIIRPRVLSLSDVVGEMIKLFERTLGEDVLIDQSFAEGLWPIKVDRSQLDQVLLNLVVNARQAMPDGGRLSIEVENCLIDEHYAAMRPDIQAGEYVMIAVSDTGVGMSREVQERVFEPFFTTRGKEGNGLGLATVFGAVRQNGGHIWLYSEEGKGTTVKIFWPRHDGKLSKETERIKRRVASFRQRTALVVEDEPALLELTTRLLERAGFEVLSAQDGLQALEISNQHMGDIDLLLTDVVMPHMNGKELSSRLMKKRPDMRTLYVSGYTQNTIVRGGVLDDDVDFLPKPFSLQSLVMSIEALFDE